jgi:16S rRNA (cytidine1402-2'-O)-methyltransferase
MAGVLYLVSTPIGNLGDITLRAIETLKAVDIIAAEDTRQTKKLLTHLGIVGKTVESLHAHSSDRDMARLIEALTTEEKSVALVSDAGTPIVSDPGDELVNRSLAIGVKVIPIPGPSATLAALVASGFGGGGFRFLGFLPRDGTQRNEALAKVCATSEPVILFESPERTNDTLKELADLTPDRLACVARELTKIHEEVVRAPLIELATNREEWRGEVVIVLGAFQTESREAKIDDAAIDARIDRELAAGTHSKTIAERLAAWSGRPKRDLYERVVTRKRERQSDEG